MTKPLSAKARLVLAYKNLVHDIEIALSKSRDMLAAVQKQEESAFDMSIGACVIRVVVGDTSIVHQQRKPDQLSDTDRENPCG